jgi:hypothetical protein
VSLDYHTPSPPPKPRHDQIYTTLLGVVCVLVLLGIVSVHFISKLSTMTPDVRAILMMEAGIEAIYLLFLLAVLLVRLIYPSYRRWPTLGVNILLLLFFPFGTALGIYGLWKVDKNL